MQPDHKNVAPTAQKKEDGQDTRSSDGDWLRRAQAAFLTSTTYVDTSLRKNWDDSIRAFNNQHPSDSKYLNPAYDKRSHLYRPKLRSVMRKNEAVAAAAFFSNIDVVDITPTDQSNKLEVASSEIMKQLLQYRLTKSIPWFQIALGGLQDAQNIGVVCAHIYWDYKTKPQVEAAEIEIKPMEASDEEYPKQAELPEGTLIADETNKLTSTQAEAAQSVDVKAVVGPKPISDKPVIKLIPVENLRVDPSCAWEDPVNSSPYVIELIPMYAMDIKTKMTSGEWRKYGDGMLRAAGETQPDSTRSARVKDRADQYDSTGKELMDYEIVWVQRHIHRRDDEDWEFYTLGDVAMLTTPRSLSETVFHGKRPYVMGCCVLETHKPYPSSIPQLGRGLADEANEIANQRIDNIKFVLNKKYFIKRGKDVDIGGLVRNVPGGVVSMDDPINDVREITWPDVTSSAYEEQGRIDNDMAELLGNFNSAQVMADHGIQGPARNMAILSQSAGTLVEYLLRTYVETFVQPVLRQLIALEQSYETDQVILAIAAKKANLLQKYGIDQVTDELLEQELTLTVNVGMGATDPGLKLQKFVTAMNSYVSMAAKPVPGLNLQEVGKEIFGHLGYSDGTRFFTSDNPQVAQLQQQLQQAQQIIQQLQAKANDKMAAHQVKIATTQHNNETKLQAVHIHEDNENMRNAVTHSRALVEAQNQRKHEAMMAAINVQHKQVPPMNRNQRSMGSAK